MADGPPLTARDRLIDQAKFHQACFKKYRQIPNGPEHVSELGWTDAAAADYHKQMLADFREALGLTDEDLKDQDNG